MQRTWPDQLEGCRTLDLAPWPEPDWSFALEPGLNLAQMSSIGFTSCKDLLLFINAKMH